VEPPAEDLAVDALWSAAGADVVFNLTDSHVPLRFVAALQDGDASSGELPDHTPPVSVVGSHDADACRLAPDVCVGAASTNWRTLIERALGEMSRGEWLPSSESWTALADHPDESGVWAEPA